MEANTIYKKKICKVCNKEFLITDKNRRFTTCSYECQVYRDPEKLKKGRDKYLRENPDKHPWKNKNKHISKPCEDFKKILCQKNISFVEEFTPLKHRHYSIDIAFPDIKVGIEINGNQHYNKDKTLAAYYQDRHDKIEAEGWILYEIHYSKVYDLMFIEELLSKINRREQISYDFYIKKDKSEFVGPTKPTKKQLKYIDDLLLLDKLKKSNINFYKFGWVNEAAKLLNIKIQHINKFLKRLDPEFYSTCYVRSTFVGPPKPNTDQIRESKIYTKLKNLKESNVDFTNKKWTKEASIILDIPSNRVRSWIRKHDPEYFNYIKEAK